LKENGSKKTNKFWSLEGAAAKRTAVNQESKVSELTQNLPPVTPRCDARAEFLAGPKGNVNPNGNSRTAASPEVGGGGVGGNCIRIQLEFNALKMRASATAIVENTVQSLLEFF
jgi:hypothetical protein